ncbi:MAG: hypothetical protein ACRD1T_08325, partial [Acidimicrobiia bacterium]
VLHRRKVAISADVGPDLISPYRVPTHLIAYVAKPFDPGSLELVAAEGAADANVIIRWPKDDSVFGTKATTKTAQVADASMQLADPTQMIWDLHQLGGEDRIEAANRLREWLLTSR